MKLKKIIKNCIPDKLLYRYYLKKINKNKNRSNKEIEKIINKDYEKIFKRTIDWSNPQTYTEKINVSKLYNANDIKTNLTDKIKAREYVKEKVGEEYLVPLLGVYEKFDDIKFDSLPNKFVIKCNHDSGSTTLCDKRNKLNLKKLRNKYNYFLKRNYAYYTYEMHYKNIEPKIMIEKYMGDSVNDYKFLCFNGEPYYCWVDIDRFKNHKRNIYDLEWNLQKFNQMTYGNSEEKIEKPKDFELMKKIAKTLSAGFDHVRVDLYYIEEKIYFGEMTFTNGNGFELINPDEYDYKLGKLWKWNKMNIQY